MESKRSMRLVKDVRFYLLISFIFFLFRFFHNISTYKETILVRTIDDLWRFIFVFPLVYLLYEHAIPLVTKKRTNIIQNIVVGFGLLILFIMLFSWGLYVWRALGILLHIYTPLGTVNSPDEIATAQMSFSMMMIVLFGISRHVYQHIRLKQSTQQLLIEKQQAELGYLKSQTNPHFLFNTLNNIYSLARDKNDLAPESILRLSKILRFMLYEAGGEYIPVEQELRIIGDYIELEKLRYDEFLRINFSHDVEDMKQAVPPLLMIPLVENAFKHGVSETRGDPFVEIHLAVRNRILIFVVKNSSERQQTSDPVTGNIGLSNLRRQLELLYKEYELDVEQGANVFTTVLTINLASHV